jgi:membrane protein DedA with SNARE-associated domain
VAPAPARRRHLGVIGSRYSLSWMIASLTSQLTSSIGHHGVYAVFALMAVDALLPVGGELIMIYAGALAGGAIAGQHAVVFGTHPTTGIDSYVVLALAGSLGYLVGALVGWTIGARGGRSLIEQHGRRLHVGPEAFKRAERWFERFGNRAVFLGRLTPVVRSFISIPAGALGSPLGPYIALTLLGSLIWCFGFAAAGWAVGGAWETFHHDFRYADYAAILTVLGLAVAVVWHRRRPARPAPDSAAKPLER